MVSKPSDVNFFESISPEKLFVLFYFRKELFYYFEVGLREVNEKKHLKIYI